MEQVLVSVVMPSYNHKEFVGKAIESVLRQTYKNFEFIIADDGSTDGSPEVISQYDDPRIKFIKFEQNTGFGALEYAFGIAKGEYIASIASDDMWHETILEKYITFLENHSDYGACFCKPQIINENDQRVENSAMKDVFCFENNTKEGWFRKLYLNGNCICAPAMCVRGELFKKLGGFRFQYRQLEDYECWLRLLSVSNIYIYPEALCMYRVHENGENRNISTPTLETLLRSRMERKHILLNIMEGLEEEFFLNTFKGDLIFDPKKEGYCLECEKFGVMLKTKLAEAACFYYFNHYNDVKFRDCLEKYYHVLRKDFWELTGANHERDARDSKLEELINVIHSLKLQLSEKEELINTLKNV